MCTVSGFNYSMNQLGMQNTYGMSDLKDLMGPEERLAKWLAKASDDIAAALNIARAFDDPTPAAGISMLLEGLQSQMDSLAAWRERKATYEKKEAEALAAALDAEYGPAR